MTNDDDITLFLRARGAGNVAHAERTLLEHSEGTRTLLRAWNSSRVICDAGACHAVYGTFGFNHTLLDLSERDELVALIGPEAEALVYLYASCDRTHVYPQLGREEPVQFRDRFTGELFTLEDAGLRPFMEMTFANELDLASQGPAGAAAIRQAYGELFLRSRSLVSSAAFECFKRLCQL